MTSNEGATEGCSCGLGADGLNESYPRYREAKAFHPSTSVNQPCLRTRLPEWPGISFAWFGAYLCACVFFPCMRASFASANRAAGVGEWLNVVDISIITFQLSLASLASVDPSTGGRQSSSGVDWYRGGECVPRTIAKVPLIYSPSMDPVDTNWCLSSSIRSIGRGDWCG